MVGTKCPKKDHDDPECPNVQCMYINDYNYNNQILLGTSLRYTESAQTMVKVTSTVVSNRLEMSILLFQMAKLGVYLMVNNSKLTEQKKQTYISMSTTCDTLCVKISSKSVYLTTRHCKVKVPYQSRQKRVEVTCIPKIDHLNYGKRPIKHKHILGEFSLSGQSRKPILGAKFVFFVRLTSTYTKSTGQEMAKMGVCVSKMAEKKNKTPFTGIQVRLTLSTNQKNRSKIGSLYEEIFQHKSTVPNDKYRQVRVTFR